MRNASTPALILNVQPQGEHNRSATVLAPDDGIFFATLYGGPKSKLRSLVSPMNTGVLYLYKDDAKKSIKITDFDVQKYHLSFRENLYKTWAASLAAELVIKTRCAGSPAQVWRLVNGFLDGMELSDEHESKIGLVRFLWRYLGVLGVRPSTAACCQCGASLMAGAFSAGSARQRYVYDGRENGFACPDCSDGAGAELPGIPRLSLSKGAITYLEAVGSLSPRDVRAIPIGGQPFLEMKQLCFFLVEQACGSKLRSLESGIGIL